MYDVACFCGLRFTCPAEATRCPQCGRRVEAMPIDLEPRTAGPPAFDLDEALEDLDRSLGELERER